jgi:hypothetical protein
LRPTFRRLAAALTVLGVFLGVLWAAGLIRPF